MIENIYKSWKTTLIGIILILTSIAYVFINSNPDYLVLITLLGTGISLLFLADTFISKLKTIISNALKLLNNN